MKWLWIGRCTVAANHFHVQGGGVGSKASFVRDSEGLATSRCKKYKEGRKRILRVHARGRPLEEDVSLDAWALRRLTTETVSQKRKTQWNGWPGWAIWAMTRLVMS